jgi:hypothetical protein
MRSSRRTEEAEHPTEGTRHGEFDDATVLNALMSRVSSLSHRQSRCRWCIRELRKPASDRLRRFWLQLQWGQDRHCREPYGAMFGDNCD